MAGKNHKTTWRDLAHLLPRISSAIDIIDTLLAECADHPRMSDDEWGDHSSSKRLLQDLRAKILRSVGKKPKPVGSVRDLFLTSGNEKPVGKKEEKPVEPVVALDGFEEPEGWIELPTSVDHRTERTPDPEVLMLLRGLNIQEVIRDWEGIQGDIERMQPNLAHDSTTLMALGQIRNGLYLLRNARTDRSLMTKWNLSAPPCEA